MVSRGNAGITRCISVHVYINFDLAASETSPSTCFAHIVNTFKVTFSILEQSRLSDLQVGCVLY